MAAVPHDRRDFKVAIICALPLEAENVQAVFDRNYDDDSIRFGKAGGDQNEYTNGVIGRHNVVLVHMPGMGSVSAAAVAANLRTSYPEIELALVVGICGVVPVHPETQEEIVLGDVVISTAVTQYDFGRQYPEGFRRKREIEDSLGRASPAIRAMLNKLKTRQNRQRVTKNLARHLHSEDFRAQNPNAEYLGHHRDWLFKASYGHQHQSPQECVQCHNGLETCSKSCDELGCNMNELIARNRQSQRLGGELVDPDKYVPCIHFGRFGSANTVMKSGVDRDKVAAIDKVIAFEMEGAGVWEQHPTIVIKAACDYADSHKNKDWQEYAAAVAATCLKVFLEEWVMADQWTDKVIWHVPCDRSSRLIGRTNELMRIKSKILDANGRHVVSILGLGGVGKTRLALELADNIRSEQPQYSVFWVQAADLLTLEKDLRDIGKQLGVPGINDEKADVKILMKQWLSQPIRSPWVMILDNADNEELWGRPSTPEQPSPSLVNCLPRNTKGAIIVTTRTRGVATFLSGKDVVDLAELSPDHAVEMFMDGLEKPGLAIDQKTSLSVVEHLAYLPLAIIQASSYINQSQINAKAYLKLLCQEEDQVIELLSKDFDVPSDIRHTQRPVAVTWLISFQHIRDRHPLAIKFLSYMACLHEKNIPISLLPNDRPNAVTDAMAVLSGYSFIKLQNSKNDDDDDKREPLCSMHRLVHLCIRNWLKEEGQFEDAARNCIIHMIKVLPRPNHESRELWSAFLPHVQHLCVERCMGLLPERYEVLGMMGFHLMLEGKYAEAVESFSCVVQWREKTFGVSHVETLSSYSRIGIALVHAGDHSRADRYLQRALSGLTTAVGPEHDRTLASMYYRTLLYTYQHRWTEASETCEKLVELSRKVYGVQAEDTLTSIQVLALIYEHQKRLKEAEALQIELLSACKRLFRNEHPYILRVMANLALTYHEQGRSQEAEELGAKALDGRTRVLGSEHPDTLVSMADLALTNQLQGRFQEAEELGAKALDGQTRVLGSEHPDTLTSMANLALTYYEQGRFQRAEELGAKALDGQTRVLGSEHPDTLASMVILALTYYEQGRLQRAEELGAKALDGQTRVLGSEHPDTLTSMANLALTYYEQGRFQEAEELGAKALDGRTRVLGSEHPATLETMYDLAGMYMAGVRADEAVALMTACARLREKVLGSDDPGTKMASEALKIWTSRDS